MIVSEKRLAANRLNALKSTGPRTVEGKARSSRNAVTHGVFSSQVILECENKPTFDVFRDGMMRDLAPVGELETMLADRVIVCAWKMRRLLAAERQALQNGVEQRQAKLDAKWREDRRYATKQERDNLPTAPAVATIDEVFHSVPERIHKYEQMLERCLYKAMDQLKQWQKIRADRPEVAVEESDAGGGEAVTQSNEQIEPTSTWHGLPARVDDGNTCETEPIESGRSQHGLEAHATSAYHGLPARDGEEHGLVAGGTGEIEATLGEDAFSEHGRDARATVQSAIRNPKSEMESRCVLGVRS